MMRGEVIKEKLESSGECVAIGEGRRMFSGVRKNSSDLSAGDVQLIMHVGIDGVGGKRVEGVEKTACRQRINLPILKKQLRDFVEACLESAEAVSVELMRLEKRRRYG